MKALSKLLIVFAAIAGIEWFGQNVLALETNNDAPSLAGPLGILQSHAAMAENEPSQYPGVFDVSNAVGAKFFKISPNTVREINDEFLEQRARADFRAKFGDAAIAGAGIAIYKLSYAQTSTYEDQLKSLGLTSKCANNAAKFFKQCSKKIKLPCVALAVAAGGAMVEIYDYLKPSENNPKPLAVIGPDAVYTMDSNDSDSETWWKFILGAFVAIFVFPVCLWLVRIKVLKKP